MGSCCVGDCGFCCVVDCGFCCVFDTSSSSGGCGYHPRENKTEDHATIIANELAEMKEKMAEQTQKEEIDILKSISLNMKQFIDSLEEINGGRYGGKQLNINKEEIIRQNDALSKKVIGFMAQRMEDRLVHTDRELSLILQERDKATRDKNFDDFVERVRKSAIRDLIEIIQEAVKAQSDVIDREIRGRLQEVNSSMEEEIKKYQELRELKEKRAEEMAARQSEYMFEHTLCDLLLDEVQAGRKDAV